MAPFDPKVPVSRDKAPAQAMLEPCKCKFTITQTYFVSGLCYMAFMSENCSGPKTGNVTRVYRLTEHNNTFIAYHGGLPRLL